jgi:hypothetical protein
MKTPRSMYPWKKGNAFIQWHGDSFLASNSKGFIVREPLDLSMCLHKRGFAKKDSSAMGAPRGSMLPEFVYQFGFEPGSRGYDGFRFRGELENGIIKEKYLPDGQLYTTFMHSTDVDAYGLTEFCVCEDSLALHGDHDELPLLKLEAKEHDYGSLSVRKIMHEYIIDNTGADKFFAAPKSVAYLRGDDRVGCLSPQLMAIGKDGKEINYLKWLSALAVKES